MKYILFLFSLGLFFNCEGQTPIITGHYGFPGENLPSVDTEKVWFLVVDMTPDRLRANTYVQSIKQFGVAFIIPGYIARKKVSDQWNESFWMTASTFLDDKKQPIDSTLIIWDSKPRK